MNESASESRLDQLLAEYLQRIDDGERISLEILRNEHPQYAEELLALIDTGQLINDLAGPTYAEEESSAVEDYGAAASTLSAADRTAAKGASPGLESSGADTTQDTDPGPRPAN